MHAVNGVQVLGESHMHGSLEVGKHADMIVLDRDPDAVDADGLHDVAADEVFLDGRTVHSGPGAADSDES